MAVVTPEARMHALEQLMPELTTLVRHGVPVEAVPNLFAMWQESLATQLANFPADLRIEAWIHERFPRLLGTQWRSPVTEVERAFPLLDPTVRVVTPPTVYQAMMAMNAAQALQVVDFLRRSDLVTPFEQHGFAAQGRHLLQLALSPKDEGHRSDMAATTAWAEELGVTGWFDWEPYQASV